MLFQDSTKDACPVCRRATTLTVIEPHPTRTGLEIHTFNCEQCGPTKSKVVAVPPLAQAEGAAGGGHLPAPRHEPRTTGDHDPSKKELSVGLGI
jgi:hypothetical protein